MSDGGEKLSFFLGATMVRHLSFFVFFCKRVTDFSFCFESKTMILFAEVLYIGFAKEADSLLVTTGFNFSSDLGSSPPRGDFIS